jgi:hypothetical protein
VPHGRFDWSPLIARLAKGSQVPWLGAQLRGDSWQEDGRLSARYWSEAVRERKEPSGIFYYWKGKRPLDPNVVTIGGVQSNHTRQVAAVAAKLGMLGLTAMPYVVGTTLRKRIPR